MPAFGLGVLGKLSRILSCVVFGWLAIGFWMGSEVQAQGRLQLPAKAAETPLGFSTLVMRLKTEDVIGVANDQYRVLILEKLREWGFHGVGAENLVFGQDDASKADFVLGGTILEVECNRPFNPDACRIGIQWQLLDVARDTVVYTVTTRYAALHVRSTKDATVGKQLVFGALHRAVVRPQFLAVLAAGHDERRAELPSYASVGYRECAVAPVAMPAGAESAMEATVIVESNGSMGSGFWLSQDGLVITAAHVVTSGALTVKTNSGEAYPAEVVRIARARDSALLRVRLPAGAAKPADTRCLPVTRDDAAVGTELYVVGTPMAKELSFSVSRGIASGVRELEGRRFLQTDAAVNPGNSGGPMLAADGHVVAIASWKIAHVATEGLSFGVPMSTVLDALALEAAPSTDPALLTGPAQAGVPQPKSTGVLDMADPVASYDPDGDARREQRAAERRREALEDEAEAKRDADHARRVAAITPTYIPVMRWTAIGAAGLGVIGIATTSASYDSHSSTHREYERLRTFNDLSWVALIAGAAAYGVSWILQPTLRDADEASAPQHSLRFTGHGVRMEF